jgi:predicted phage tail protein
MGGLAGLGATTIAAGVLQSAGLLTASAAVPVLLPIALGAATFVGINRYRRMKARTVEAAIEVLTAVGREITTTAATRAKQAVTVAKNRTAQEIDEALAEEAARITQARQDLSDSANLTPEQRALHLAEAADVLTRVDELGRELADLKGKL